MNTLTICMYGAASDRIDPVYFKKTRALGREIAGRKHRLIYGGGASGLMGACAEGCQEVNGTVIGVVPHFMRSYERLNDNCTKLIQTENMAERKLIMEDTADAFIIVPGGIGTLDEFFEILTLTELGRQSKPILLYNIEGFFDLLIALLEDGIRKGFINKKVRDLYIVSHDPIQALNLIECAVQEEN
ncbi:MAG: TIGR00730 family Rossman fold protein [Eubacterium sp.]|nr:TIGR00730 family Rossman fold protein [Eubacterium sp.]